MLHFPSKLQSNSQNGLQNNLNLNATQQKSASHPIFLKIEEELHDARRVHSHGQEDDLRYALNMVINRVTELSSMLGEAYKTQADLEVQLNVAKSNLQLVIANNEMLEDALKRDTTGQSKDVGWRRTSGRDPDNKNPRASLERSQSVEFSDISPPPTASAPTSSTQENRFFKFRFNNTASPTQRPATRPGTPSAPSASTHNLNSSSMPSLATAQSKELEDITAELEKEREARKKVADEKAALEAELESLSQALFEEANNMVATERKMRAETEEELKELKMEKEALHSALRLVEGENTHLRESSLVSSPSQESELAQITPAGSRSHSRSSSRIAVKSRPTSLELPSTLPLPPSPFPDNDPSTISHVDGSHHPDAPPSQTIGRNQVEPLVAVVSPEEESYPTPKFRLAVPPTPSSPDEYYIDASPWADVPSRSSLDQKEEH